MTEYLITGIRQTGIDHGTITHYRVLDLNAQSLWDQRTWPKDFVVTLAHLGTKFWITSGTTLEPVQLVNSNPSYLRAYANGIPNNNLLALPNC